MLNHSITKSLCFYAAGLVLMTFGTREISQVRGLFRISPFTGGALLLCSLAIAGAPPFPIFLSEFSILSAGLRAGHYVAVVILATLIVVAFVAILLQVNGMLFGQSESTVPKVPLPLSRSHRNSAGRDTRLSFWVSTFPGQCIRSWSWQHSNWEGIEMTANSPSSKSDRQAEFESLSGSLVGRFMGEVSIAPAKGGYSLALSLLTCRDCFLHCASICSGTVVACLAASLQRNA